MSSLPSYALVLSLEYGAENGGRSLPLEERLAALQAEQLPGHRFAAYTDYHGSEQTIYLLIPLSVHDETDERHAPLPESQTTETLQASAVSLKTAKGLVAEYIPELSNPAGDHRFEPALYVYLILTVIRPSLTDAVRGAAWEAGRKIAAAHRQHTGGRNFLTYRTYRGSDEVIHVAIPFNGFEEPDEWGDNRELLQEVYGADEAMRLINVIAQVIKESTTSIGKRHPSNSQFQF